MKGMGWFAAVSVMLLYSRAGSAAATEALDGPLMRAARASLAAEQAKMPPPRSAKSRTDWAPVVRLAPGKEITLTLKGGLPARYRLLTADTEQVTVLDVSDPKLPDDVRKALVTTAKAGPLSLLVARTGELQLPRGVRATPDGIFLAEQRVAEVGAIVRSVPRPQVADVRVRRKHIGTHSRRGLLLGAAIGAAIGALYGASSEYDDALPLAGFGAVVGGVYGLEFGTVAGILSPRSDDVIYHVD